MVDRSLWETFGLVLSKAPFVTKRNMMLQPTVWDCYGLRLLFASVY